MANKSKNKGSAWERDICKFLSNLYNDNFERVPYSGAFIGGKNSVRRSSLTENQSKIFKGDILPPDHWNKFNCEAKNYASFPFHKLLFNSPVPLLEQWLDQLMEVAEPGDVNVLFIKVTRIGQFVVFDKEHTFDTHRYLHYTDSNNREWTITEFNSFFALNADAFEKANIS